MAKIRLEAKKRLVNGVLKNAQFEFELLDASGNVIERAKNDAQGNVSFGEMRFDREGTYIYYVRELVKTDNKISFDSTKYRVLIKVTEQEGRLTARADYERNGMRFDGNLTFTNTVSTPKTGDNSSSLPLYLMLLSSTALIALVFTRKKKENRQQ